MLHNKNFAKEKDGKIHLSVASILLFGKNPQTFFPRARVRFIRYEGTEEKFGAEMNVIKDVTFEGRILEQIQKAVAYIQTQIKERTYLTSGGVFTTEQEYPEFVRTELIVNAVTHRDYSIRGTEIQIKMFDDHLVVESPGNLPSQVKIETIRSAHFARNSHIAEYLKDYKYVKDFGEGVDRMCREMEAQGLPKPEYRQDAFILKAIVKNSGFASQNLGIDQLKSEVLEAKLNATTREKLLKLVENIQINQVFGAGDLMDILKCSTTTATSLIKRMKTMNLVEAVTGIGKGKYVFRSPLQ